MGLLVWILIEVTIIYLVLVAIVALQAYRACDFPTKSYYMDDHHIQTGDILGVGYRHPFGWFVTAWSSSIWSHTGIAWRHPRTQELYVLEAAVYNSRRRSADGTWRGVFRIPFRNWLRINRRHYRCHLRLSGEKAPDLAEKLDRAFAEFESCQLDYFNLGWVRFLRTQPYTEEPRRQRYTCNEITVATLQKAGVFQCVHDCSSYFAGQIVNRQIPTESNYAYLPGAEIVDRELPE